MIQIIIGNTCSNTSEALGITPATGFKTLTSNLRDLSDYLNNGGINQGSLDELIWLFEHLEIVAFSGYGNIVYTDDCTEFAQVMNTMWIPSQQKNIIVDRGEPNIHELWHRLLLDIATDIEELYNYGENEQSPEIIFLRRIQHFLTFTDITTNQSAIDYYRT